MGTTSARRYVSTGHLPSPRQVQGVELLQVFVCGNGGTFAAPYEAAQVEAEAYATALGIPAPQLDW